MSFIDFFVIPSISSLSSKDTFNLWGVNKKKQRVVEGVQNPLLLWKSVDREKLVGAKMG